MTRLWTLLITSAALFMAALDNLVVTFALPTIQRDFNTTVQGLEWTVNAYTLSFAVLLMTGAALGDRFGRKRVFMIGLAVFTFASALCALAPNIDALIAARVLQGFGGAIITPLVLTITSGAFPDEKRGLALGISAAVAGVAIALGPVVGGALVTGISWQWIFWINVPIGVITLSLAIPRLRESYGPQGRMDRLGLLLVSASMFGLVFGVIRGSDIGWTQGEVIASLVGGAFLVPAFIVWELRALAPMLPMRFFRSRAFTTANAASLFMYFGMFGSIFLLAQFLQVAQGYSALEAGLRTLPWTAVPIVVAPLAGLLAERIGARPLLVVSFALQTIGLAWIAIVLAPDVEYVKMVPSFVILGVGMAMFFSPVALLVLDAVSPEEEGQASGANNAIRELGGVFGIAVLATVFGAHGSYASPEAFTDGVVPASWMGVAALAAGALIALAVPPLRRGTGGDMAPQPAPRQPPALVDINDRSVDTAPGANDLDRVRGAHIPPNGGCLTSSAAPTRPGPSSWSKRT